MFAFVLPLLLSISLSSCSQFRLVNGPNSASGRIEVYHGGVWGTVCDDGFAQSAGDMICKKLGYHYASALVPRAGYGAGSGKIWLDDLVCTDITRGVDGCSHIGWGKHNCAHSEDMGLKCAKQFRLVNGSNPSSGRIEVLHNNLWGTVCDDGFAQTAGNMVCKTLGYSYASHLLPNAGFGQGSGRTWIDDLTCSSSIKGLTGCRHSGWGVENCVPSEDMGVRCMPEFRLLGGPNDASGRIEVRFNNAWGTVCDDSFNQNAGNMICKELGYQRALRWRPVAYYGPGTGNILLDDLSCTTSTSKLGGCTHSPFGVHNCAHSEDMSVDCMPAFRLVNGTSSSGRVEVYYKNQWGTICDDYFNQKAGDMICKAMGFRYVVQLAPVARYGRGTGPIWLDDLRCSASNIGLAGCTFKPWGYNNCGHGEDMGLVCGST